MAQTSCETLEDDDGENEYHSWLAKFGHDCIDFKSDAATVSRGSTRGPTRGADIVTSCNEKESNPSCRLGMLLLWGIEKESLSPKRFTAFAQLIISLRLDVTCDEDRFRLSIPERLHPTPIDGRAYQKDYLVLVGDHAKGGPITTASFMLAALKYHRSVLNTCPPCRIDFIELNVIEDMHRENTDFKDPWAVDMSTYLTVARGTYSSTIRAP